VTVEHRLLVKQCNETVIADNVKPRTFIMHFVKKSMSGSVAMFPQFEKSIVSAVLPVAK